MTEVIPAILSKDWNEIRHQIDLVKDCAKTVQIDIADGQFVQSKTWPFFSGQKEEFQHILDFEEGLPYWERLDYEIDMMVSNPKEEIERWIQVGAKRFIVHIESLKNPELFFEELEKNHGYKAHDDYSFMEIGLGINIDTANERVLKLADKVDFVQCMGIDVIGFQHQGFDPKVIKKIEELKKAKPDLVISVDGGVTLENAKELSDVGANRLVSGSAIFSAGSPCSVVQEYENILK